MGHRRMLPRNAMERHSQQARKLVSGAVRPTQVPIGLAMQRKLEKIMSAQEDMPSWRKSPRKEPTTASPKQRKKLHSSHRPRDKLDDFLPAYAGDKFGTSGEYTQGILYLSRLGSRDMGRASQRPNTTVAGARRTMAPAAMTSVAHRPFTSPAASQHRRGSAEDKKEGPRLSRKQSEAAATLSAIVRQPSSNSAVSSAATTARGHTNDNGEHPSRRPLAVSTSRHGRTGTRLSQVADADESDRLVGQRGGSSDARVDASGVADIFADPLTPRSIDTEGTPESPSELAVSMGLPADTPLVPVRPSASPQRMLRAAFGRTYHSMLSRRGTRLFSPVQPDRLTNRSRISGVSVVMRPATPQAAASSSMAGSNTRRPTTAPPAETAAQTIAVMRSTRWEHLDGLPVHDLGKLRVHNFVRPKGFKRDEE